LAPRAVISLESLPPVREGYRLSQLHRLFSQLKMPMRLGYFPEIILVVAILVIMATTWHPSVVPIRVSRFAIDDRTPQRDLCLSQEHCLLIDEVLIPAKYLVNGSSIAFDDDARMSETIEYLCVVFDTHEVIFAEGAATESFLYAGGQIPWDNLDDYQCLYGSQHKMMSPLAPICRYSGGRAEVRGLFRLAASRFVDVRDPIQIAYDRIAARAMAIAA
jgi:hypothetical protein